MAASSAPPVGCQPVWFVSQAGGFQQHLIKDLVSPLNEMVRVINAVSNGDLSPTVPVEIDGKLGRPSRGQRRGRTWKGLTESVNGKAANLTSQVRNNATRRCLSMMLLVFTLDDWRCALELSTIERVYRAVAVTPLPDARISSRVSSTSGALCYRLSISVGASACRRKTRHRMTGLL